MLTKLKNRWVRAALLIGLCLYAVSSFAITVVNTTDSTGGTDLFTYWRINHFTRQGEEPYRAFLQNYDIQLPVQYINGDPATTHPIVETDVDQKQPGNSPLILIFLLPMSFLTWGTAKMIWMILNIALVLATPWLAIKLFASRLNLLLGAMMALVYYGLPGIRASIVTGQTSVIIIFLILLTLWLLRNNRKLLAGLALGLALSKFSVAIPLFLFLIYKKSWTTLAVGLLAQGVAFVIFAILRQGSPIEVVSDFASIAGAHAGDHGIHLTGSLEPSASVSILVGVVFSFAVFIPLGYLISRERKLASHLELFDHMVFGALCIWSLLVAYHKAYDIGLVVAVLVVAIYALSNPCLWGIGNRLLWWMLPSFLAIILVLSTPVRFVEDVVGGWWEPFITTAFTVDLVLILLFSLLILRQVGRMDAGEGRMI
jgi:hypothetical protein